MNENRYELNRLSHSDQEALPAVAQGPTIGSCTGAKAFGERLESGVKCLPSPGCFCLLRTKMRWGSVQ